MKNIELLAPAGDFESLKAAVQNGADAVYLGTSSFNARAKATNFNSQELIDAIKYAKLRNVKVNLALNTLIKNDEFKEALNIAIQAYNLGVDAIIVQDLGLASFLLKNYNQIPLHASTQMSIHNLDGVKQLEKMGFSRVVLARELSISEIEYIRKNTNIELEVFIHGALCISYSGQCLFSSMIGKRSGNRGLCAQPCRLPYKLCMDTNNKETSTVLDSGYILSPRDNLGIEFLPELIKLGIDSLKIEGRMKTPTYVGVVTKIYRKYIDLVLKNINLDNNELKFLINKQLDIINENTGLSDRQEITQVFNRGGFSSGHFGTNINNNFIFKNKPNNMGIYVGTISHINENKGHLTLKLEDNLSIGDRISINDENYTISELMINNKNFENLYKGQIVKIGRMKGNISVGSKVYRIESARLNQIISPTFKDDKNFKKIKLNGEIIVKKDSPISFKISSNEGFYSGLEIIVKSSTIPQIALNQAITEEKIIDQISKTGNTQFEFENIKVILDNNLFIQISVLNDIRRKALEQLEDVVIQKNSHHLINTTNIYNLTTSIKNNTNKKISLLLNILDKNVNYLILENIDNLYIPLKYFFDNTYTSILKNLSKKFNTYIYLPNILKDKIINNLNLNNIVSDFNIKGFVVSNLSQIEKLKQLNLELIGNFNLNIYNNYSVQSLKDLNLSTYTISPELNKIETNDVLKNANLKSEIIVYGKIPVMTNNYCYISKSNKCDSTCMSKCQNSSKFYLKDRMNFEFRIIPDNFSKTTTIYNSKILSIEYNDILCNSIRIDILDESIDKIQNIINTVKSGNCFNGKDYTNGYY